MGLHLCRLLHPYGRIRQGHSLSAQVHQARDAPQTESARVVPHGPAAGSRGQQARSLQGLPPRHASCPSLPARLQRPHRHDRGAVGGTVEEDDRPTETHGRQRQQQGLSRPSVLCHRQHLSGTARHRSGHFGLRERKQEGNPLWDRERCVVAQVGRLVLES